MFPITVTIIARNEADRIAAAIHSVGFASEVLVLDSGSTDDTVRCALDNGARVIETDWPGHVAQKNRAMVEARHDWILSIDADERVSKELAKQIQMLSLGDSGPAGYRFARLTWWMGQAIRYGAWYPDARVRLFDRRRARWSGRNPHDRIELTGPADKLAGELVHHPYRNLGEHFRTIDDYTRISAQEALKDGVRARFWDPLVRPLLHFVKAILLKLGFMDGIRGWCIAFLGATYVSVKWTRIYIEQSGDSEESSS